MHQIMAALLLIPFLSSCGLHHSPPKEHHERPTREQLDNINYPAIVDLVYSYAAELRKEKHIVLQKSRALFDEKLNKLRLEFESEELISLEMGRELITDVAEELLRRVNFNMSLHSILRDHPFTADDLEISIRFRSLYGHFTDPDYLCFAELKDGIVGYQGFTFYDEEKDPYDCKYELYSLTLQLASLQKIERMPYSQEVEPLSQNKRAETQRYYPPPKS